MRFICLVLLLLVATSVQAQTNPYRKRTFTYGMRADMSLPGASDEIVRRQIRLAIADCMAINPGLTIKFSPSPQIRFVKAPHYRNALTYYGRIPGTISYSTTPPSWYKWWSGQDYNNSIYIGAFQELQRPILGVWSDSKRDWARINAELTKAQALRKQR